MSAEEPGPRRSWVEKPRGSEARVDVADGALVTCDLEVELTDVVLETSDPAGLLCVAVAGLFLALTDKLREFLDEISNLCWTRVRKRGANHSDDGRGEGARVVIGPGRAVQQKLL